jgi:hypothetical protein
VTLSAPEDVERPDTSSRRDETVRRRIGAGWVLAAAMVVSSGAILYLGRGLTFFNDEWALALERRGWSPADLLEPSNEHLSVVPVVVFKLLLATVGMTHYWPYRLVLVAFHLVCVGLVFVVARRRAGEELALAAAILILFLGSAWEDVFWPFQISFLISVACGLALLLLLERPSGSRDVAACGLVAIAIASSSIGLAVAAMALTDTGLRRAWGRLWIALVPLVLYVAWFAHYGRSELEGGGSMRVNLTGVPRYVADAAAGAAGAVTGLGLDWGRPLLLAAVGLAVWRLPFLSRRVATLLVGALAYWSLIALARAHLGAPASSRYLYFGAVLLVLIAVEVLRTVPLGVRFTRLLAIVVAIAVVANLHELRAGARALRVNASVLGAELAALELARGKVEPTFRPDPVRAPRLPAGRYFAAVDEFGSPAATIDELLAKPEFERQEADRVLVAALGVTAVPSRGEGGRRAPAVTSVRGGTTRRNGPCFEFRADSPEAALELSVESPLLVRSPSASPVRVWVRRLATSFRPEPLTTVPAGSEAGLVLPRLLVPGQWHARVVPAGGTTTLCSGRS